MQPYLCSGKEQAVKSRGWSPGSALGACDPGQGRAETPRSVNGEGGAGALCLLETRGQSCFNI